MPSTFTTIRLSTANSQFPLSVTKTYFTEVNIHVNTNPVYISGQGTPEQLIPAGTVLTFKDINAQDVFFRSANAGNSAEVVAYGSVKQ